MCKRVSLVVVAVLVSASCSALPISTVSQASKYDYPVQDESIIQAERERKQKLRVNNNTTDVSYGERARLPISKRWSAKELLEAGAPKPNQSNNRNHVNFNGYHLDVKKFQESMQKLRALLDTSKIPDDKLIPMAVENEYFKTLGPSRSYYSPHGPKSFQKNMDSQLFDSWKKLLDGYGYQSRTVFEKMRVLKRSFQNTNIKGMDIAYMAIGSEFLSGKSGRPRGIPILPSSTYRLEHVSKQGGVPVPLSRTNFLELVSNQRGVDLSKSKEWMERLKNDPTYKYKSHEDLVWDATGRAMGDDLTLG